MSLHSPTPLLKTANLRPVLSLIYNHRRPGREPHFQQLSDDSCHSEPRPVLPPLPATRHSHSFFVTNPGPTQEEFTELRINFKDTAIRISRRMFNTKLSYLTRTSVPSTKRMTYPISHVSFALKYSRVHIGREELTLVISGGPVSGFGIVVAVGPSPTASSSSSSPSAEES